MSVNYQPTRTAIVLTYATQILFSLITLIKNLASGEGYVVLLLITAAPTSRPPAALLLGHRRAGHSLPGQHNAVAEKR